MCLCFIVLASIISYYLSKTTQLQFDWYYLEYNTKNMIFEYF